MAPGNFLGSYPAESLDLKSSLPPDVSLSPHGPPAQSFYF